MINNRQLRAIRDVSTLDNMPQSDIASITAEIESQIEMFRSDNVGLSVVKKLSLESDPYFVNGPEAGLSQMLAHMISLFSSNPKLSSEEEALVRQSRILKVLNSNMSVSRVGHSFLIEVKYSSPNAKRSAQIANAYANAFITEDLNAQIEAANRARAWLQQRAEELRKTSLETDSAVQKFKADNNLLDAKGTLISEQELNEMASQLIMAQATTEQAKARYQHLKEIIDKHQTDAVVTESLSDPILSALRTKYIDLAARMKKLQSGVTPLSASHAVIVSLANELETLSERIFEELGRVAETYRADYEVAAARQNAINDDLKRQRTIAVAANDALVQLRQLEEKADSYKSLYQTFLQRYQETDQQENFPIAGSRIVSPAVQPLKPNYPRKTLVLAVALAAGSFLGIGIGMLRESLDRVFRTVEQIRDVLGVPVLGMLPFLQQESTTGDKSVIMRYAIDNPFSSFAETLRSARIAVDHATERRPLKVIGVTSLLPNEGKSTVSKNFASSLALHGFKTLLIDSDMRNPFLTKVMGYDLEQNSHGNMQPLGKILKCEPESGLQILPSIYAPGDPRTANGLSLRMLESHLDSIRESGRYDYIVLDLPPVGPVATARDLAPVIDSFIFVVAWGETARYAVKAVLAKEVAIRQKLVGVILNKVPMKRLGSYATFGSEGHYHRLYEDYYSRDGDNFNRS